MQKQADNFYFHQNNEQVYGMAYDVVIWSQTVKTPVETAKCRNPLGLQVRVSSAQAHGKRNCLAEYQHYHLTKPFYK